MMEMKEFQGKLARLLELAVSQAHNLSHQDILECFGENQLSPEQLNSLYEYLKIQGIRIEGQEFSSQTFEAEEKEKQEISEKKEKHITRKRIPLEDDDWNCLQQYQAYLKDRKSKEPGERERLLAAYASGDGSVMERLADLYLPELLEMAQDLYTSDVALGDLIQEGNMCLLMTGPDQIPDNEADGWMIEQMQQAMKIWLNEQIDLKLQDESMVEKVRRLEAAIRELSDDDNPRFTVEELSAYLDVDVEQIQDILKLTGDDGNNG